MTNPLCIALTLFLAAATGGAMGSETAATATKGKIVCVDPGHCKQRGGASGKKLEEYRVCWEMAGELKTLLEKKGVAVILTKSSAEEDVPTRERSEIANRAKADLLIRLHCDHADDSGFATYYPAREGKAEGARGPSKAIIAASEGAARRFHASAIKSLGGALRDRGLRTDSNTDVGAKQGALTGSVFARVPVILVEMCVLSNPKDEAFIDSAEGRAKLARAMAEGTRAALTISAPAPPIR